MSRESNVPTGPKGEKRPPTCACVSAKPGAGAAPMPPIRSRRHPPGRRASTAASCRRAAQPSTERRAQNASLCLGVSANVNYEIKMVHHFLVRKLQFDRNVDLVLSDVS